MAFEFALIPSCQKFVESSRSLPKSTACWAERKDHTSKRGASPRRLCVTKVGPWREFPAVNKNQVEYRADDYAPFEGHVRGMNLDYQSEQNRNDESSF